MVVQTTNVKTESEHEKHSSLVWQKNHNQNQSFLHAHFNIEVASSLTMDFLPTLIVQRFVLKSFIKFEAFSWRFENVILTILRENKPNLYVINRAASVMFPIN